MWGRGAGWVFFWMVFYFLARRGLENNCWVSVGIFWEPTKHIMSQIMSKVPGPPSAPFIRQKELYQKPKARKRKKFSIIYF
jgi:hypothetical protein